MSFCIIFLESRKTGIEAYSLCAVIGHLFFEGEELMNNFGSCPSPSPIALQFLPFENVEPSDGGSRLPEFLSRREGKGKFTLAEET